MDEEFQAELAARYNLETLERTASRSLALPSHWDRQTRIEFSKYTNRRIHNSRRDRTRTGMSLNELYGTYRSQAHKRNLEFQLSFDQFSSLMQQECHYCTQLPAWGVDRYDNRQGYLEENAVPCCGVCNLMKGSLQADLFITKCQAIGRNKSA